jgi:hypothetical protein
MLGLIKTIFCDHSWIRIEKAKNVDPKVVIFNKVKCLHCEHVKDEEFGDIPVIN